MLQRALLAVVVARLVLAPWAVAEEPVHRPGPIAAAAALAATRAEAPARRGPMPNGLKWTGLGLLMGSGMPVVVAAFGDCIREGRTCRNQRRVAYATAGAMAGTGGLLIVIADAKREAPLPALAFSDGRATIVQRVTF
jgi:hypothetical protein